MDFKKNREKAEIELYIAMRNYLKACDSELHSQRVKAGIKAAKERKAKLAEREVNKND